MLENRRVPVSIRRRVQLLLPSPLHERNVIHVRQHHVHRHKPEILVHAERFVVDRNEIRSHRNRFQELRVQRERGLLRLCFSELRYPHSRVFAQHHAQKTVARDREAILPRINPRIIGIRKVLDENNVSTIKQTAQCNANTADPTGSNMQRIIKMMFSSSVVGASTLCRLLKSSKSIKGSFRRLSMNRMRLRLVERFWKTLSGSP